MTLTRFGEPVLTRQIKKYVNSVISNLSVETQVIDLITSAETRLLNDISKRFTLMIFFPGSIKPDKKDGYFIWPDKKTEYKIFFPPGKIIAVNETTRHKYYLNNQLITPPVAYNTNDKLSVLCKTPTAADNLTLIQAVFDFKINE